MSERFHQIYNAGRCLLYAACLVVAFVMGMEYAYNDALCEYNEILSGQKSKIFEYNNLSHVFDVHIPTADEIADMIEDECRNEVEEEFQEAIKEVMGYEGDGEFV